jgi:hypothetical protein
MAILTGWKIFAPCHAAGRKLSHSEDQGRRFCLAMHHYLMQNMQHG